MSHWNSNTECKSLSQRIPKGSPMPRRKFYGMSRNWKSFFTCPFACVDFERVGNSSECWIFQRLRKKLPGKKQVMNFVKISLNRNIFNTPPKEPKVGEGQSQDGPFASTWCLLEKHTHTEKSVFCFFLYLRNSYRRKSATLSTPLRHIEPSTICTKKIESRNDVKNLDRERTKSFSV